MPKVLNFVALQLCWLACVIAAGRYGMMWLGVLVTLLFVVVHFLHTTYPRADCKLIVCGLIVGLALDSLWSTTGIIHYQHPLFFPLAPVWIGCLWVAFMLTFNHSLAWLKNHLWLAALLTMVSSPLSYYAAHQIGALQIDQPWLAAVAIGLSWSMLIPAFLILADRLSLNEQATKHALV